MMDCRASLSYRDDQGKNNAIRGINRNHSLNLLIPTHTKAL